MMNLVSYFSPPPLINVDEKKMYVIYSKFKKILLAFLNLMCFIFHTFSKMQSSEHVLHQDLKVYKLYNCQTLKLTQHIPLVMLFIKSYCISK